MVPKATLVPLTEPNDKPAASLNDFLAEILEEQAQTPNLHKKKAQKNR